MSLVQPSISLAFSDPVTRGRVDHSAAAIRLRGDRQGNKLDSVDCYLPSCRQGHPALAAASPGALVQGPVRALCSCAQHEVCREVLLYDVWIQTVLQRTEKWSDVQRAGREYTMGHIGCTLHLPATARRAACRRAAAVTYSVRVRVVAGRDEHADYTYCNGSAIKDTGRDGQVADVGAIVNDRISRGIGHATGDRCEPSILHGQGALAGRRAVVRFRPNETELLSKYTERC